MHIRQAEANSLMFTDSKSYPLLFNALQQHIDAAFDLRSESLKKKIKRDNLRIVVAKVLDITAHSAARCKDKNWALSNCPRLGYEKGGVPVDGTTL